jgi:hypothetical protein
MDGSGTLLGRRRRTLLPAALALFGSACGGGGGDDGSAFADDAGTGSGSGSADGDGGDDASPLDPQAAFSEADALGPQGLRRLTLAELSATLQLVAKLEPEEAAALIAVLPGDGSTPFDNEYALQEPSGPLVEGMLSIAEGTAEIVLGDPARRAEVLGCTPSGPDDEACLRDFAARFGRLVLRRPLTSDELDAYASFIVEAQAEGDFDVAASMVIEALLLDARFLYRVEIGEPVNGDAELFRLDDFELASRLAFLLWGSGPDDALLDLAEAGALESRTDVYDAALSLVQDQRGLDQLQRMHAMWLGYENLAVDPVLGASLRRETDELIERALVQREWLSIFTASDTWLDATLAEHYDIALPGGQPGFVDYPDIRRRGILSHGSLLSIGAKFGDTSPTERGKAVWTRLLCNEIPPPPPDVDSGLPPTGGPVDACKTERYDMREKPECASCHGILDSIGFGLENYGPSGEWRTTELDKPGCEITGEGELATVGEFAGAGALGELLLETGQLEGCYTQTFYQFAIGRRPDDTDQMMVDALTEVFEADDDVVGMLLQFAASEGFRHRRATED